MRDGVSACLSDSLPGACRRSEGEAFESTITEKEGYDHDCELARKGHQGGGAGLGLFIVKGSVEAHGERVAVDSQVGRGSEFSFQLALHLPAPPAP